MFKRTILGSRSRPTSRAWAGSRRTPRSPLRSGEEKSPASSRSGGRGVALRVTAVTADYHDDVAVMISRWIDERRRLGEGAGRPPIVWLRNAIGNGQLYDIGGTSPFADHAQTASATAILSKEAALSCAYGERRGDKRIPALEAAQALGFM